MRAPRYFTAVVVGLLVAWCGCKKDKDDGPIAVDTPSSEPVVADAAPTSEPVDTATPGESPDAAADAGAEPTATDAGATDAGKQDAGKKAYQPKPSPQLCQQRCAAAFSACVTRLAPNCQAQLTACQRACQY